MSESSFMTELLLNPLDFKTSKLHASYSLCYQQWQTTNATQDNWLWHRALLISQLRSLLCRAPGLTPLTWMGSGSIPSCIIFLNAGLHWNVTQGLQFHKSVLIPSTHGWLIPSGKPSPIYSLFKINALMPSCLPSIHQLRIPGAEVYKRTSTTTPLQELGSSWVVSSYIIYSTNMHLAYVIIIIFVTIIITEEGRRGAQELPQWA